MNTLIKTSRHSFLSICAGTALLMGAGGVMQNVQAAEEPTYIKNVNYADLNLETEKGARVLLARLRLASNEVCANLASPDLPMRAHWVACVDKAMSDAVAKINSKALSALYARTAHAPQG
jgi:UrcA family protein